VRDDLWTPVIITFKCGHQVDWRGPMMPSAMMAQVCFDCQVDGRGVHPWRPVTAIEGYPSVPGPEPG
jgi:hypothetical protein